MHQQHRRTAVALRHVAFEDLGTWDPVLRRLGYAIEYLDVPDATHLDRAAIAAADLLVVLGGPVGVDQSAQYPFLRDEVELLRARLDARRPTIGVCLGAQLIAVALGATVESGAAAEIGFGRLELTTTGDELEELRGVDVFSWHADRFTLPDGARHLASTPACPCQAFAVGEYVLALQFHPELDVDHLERWLVGHAHELSARGIDPRSLRRDAHRSGERLRDASARLLERWLSNDDALVSGTQGAHA